MFNFICPICGNNYLIEHWTGVSKEILINTLTESNPIYENALINDEREEFAGYFCSNCLFQIMDETGRPIQTYPELIEYIKNAFIFIPPQQLFVGYHSIMEA